MSTTFLPNKYTKLYFSLIYKASQRNSQEGYVETHHIIPRSIGGTDVKSNLIDLLAKEHFICHYLLTKMFERETIEWYKMMNAFIMMKCHSSGRRYTSRLYEYSRKSFSEVQSFNQKGEKNSSFGKMWVHNNFKSIKIKKDIFKEYENNGYSKGRIMKPIEMGYPIKILIREKRIEELYKRYISGESLRQLAKETEFSHVSLFKIFKRYGFETELGRKPRYQKT